MGHARRGGVDGLQPCLCHPPAQVVVFTRQQRAPQFAEVNSESTGRDQDGESDRHVRLDHRALAERYRVGSVVQQSERGSESAVALS